MFKRTLSCFAFAAAVLAAQPTPVDASETRTYTYDARGRLVAAVSTGSVNNNRSTTYCLDKADNRAQVVSDTSGVAASCTATLGCTLTTPDRSGNESAATAYVEKVGSCPIDITLGYSIDYVSGVGSYTDYGFWYGTSVLGASQSTHGISVGASSVDDDDPLVLRITFTSTTPGVSISPAASTLTIYEYD